MKTIDVKAICKSDKLPVWITGSDDIMLLNSITLKRNIAGSKFPGKMTLPERKEIHDSIIEAIEESKPVRGLKRISLNQIKAPDRFFIFERKWFNNFWVTTEGEEAYSTLLVSEDEKKCILINNDDHIEVRVTDNKLSLYKCYEEAEKILKKIGLEYAKRDAFGYLTAIPALMGTGMQIEVMLHTPALLFNEDEPQCLEQLEDKGILIGGFFGSDSDILGNFVTLHNQNTHRSTVKSSLDFFEQAVKSVVEKEKREMEVLDPILKRDAISRAFGTLKYVHQIDFHEAFTGLSFIKLGMDDGMVEGVSLEEWKTAMCRIFPSHLHCLYDFAGDEEDIMRAEVCNDFLSKAEVVKE